MAKNPKTKARPADPAKTSTLNMEKVALAQRIPFVVLQGLDARAAKIGCSRNHAFVLAALEWGTIPAETKAAVLAQMDAEPITVASKAGTSLPDPIKPGARLDKRAIGRRLEPKPKPGKKPHAKVVADPDPEEVVL